MRQNRIVGDARYKELRALIAQVGGAGPPPAPTGDVQEIAFAVGTATVSSTTVLPATAKVVDAQLEVTTPYSAGATLEVGNAANPALLMGTGDSSPQTAALYWLPLSQPFTGGPGPVLVTVGGAPIAGAAQCIVRYVLTPNT